MSELKPEASPEKLVVWQVSSKSHKSANLLETIYMKSNKIQPFLGSVWPILFPNAKEGSGLLGWVLDVEEKPQKHSPETAFLCCSCSFVPTFHPPGSDGSGPTPVLVGCLVGWLQRDHKVGALQLRAPRQGTVAQHTARGRAGGCVARPWCSAITHGSAIKRGCAITHGVVP